ncbi:MAG: succinylglutamate desuccinylase/aspartoacylase family protein [Oscillospiraceae bacterium]|nr:succinylglutamate desuccinylase/aspartoacylase family protein [Oscillospiraceae bacterium]
MIQNIVTCKLNVDEELTIKKNTLRGSDSGGRRIAIVTGIHGDELEGQYICYRLVKHITANMSNLKGIVDIYPAVNPLGMESASRAVPMTGTDMNKVFPGSNAGAFAENIAKTLVEDICGADVCVDIHSSNIFIREIPQVRIRSEKSGDLVQYAKMLNTDMIWVHESGAVGDGSLAESLIAENIPTLVVEMGVGQRIDLEYCEQLLHGIFNLMNKLGIWAEEEHGISHPMISTDGAVHVIHADGSGIFIPCVEHNNWIAKGSILGEIVTPITGTVEQEITAPVDGVIFSLREYPIVYEGSVIARMLSLEK